MATTPSPLRALATRITKNVEAIATFCESTGHPQRSFGQIDVETLLPSGASTDLQRMKKDLVDATLELQLLATDVREFWDFRSAQVREQFLNTWNNVHEIVDGSHSLLLGENSNGQI